MLLVTGKPRSVLSPFELVVEDYRHHVWVVSAFGP